ncbi:hypothetical protein CDO52_00965 [Nocardiopsis gilva YIM 90087]|uniref:Recombinase RecT n=1 Tax=Nocardiopsis gilva YIM 90087 TaxID=1235441 RepID=A0A223S098_9ACTN|nr:recombinase RecT [Nocardiopsis gilva]ASU81550.1 hypothetical protein CDO52_00965 [Nocardiopsis gilva YIM 90087]
MSQTVRGEVARQESGPAAVITQYANWFASILPSHVDKRGFIALAKAHLRKNSKLAAAAERNPSGYMMCLSECARLGLVPGDTFHILHFENRRAETVDLVGVVDYTGEIELIYRAGAVSAVKAEIVYERDFFRFTPDMDRPDHQPDWWGERGEMAGVYAYAVMKDGATSRVVVMSRDEVMKVKAVSKRSSAPDSPWQQWEDRMWLKTAVHQLKKWVPTSAEYVRETLRAAAEADATRNRHRTPPSQQEPQPEDPVDAEIVEEPADAGAPQGADDWPEAVPPGSGGAA